MLVLPDFDPGFKQLFDENLNITWKWSFKYPLARTWKLVFFSVTKREENKCSMWARALWANLSLSRARSELRDWLTRPLLGPEHRSSAPTLFATLAGTLKKHMILSSKLLLGLANSVLFQNKGSILENHDLPSVIIKSELFINLLLLQNKASNVENSVAASGNLLPLVATGKTSLCSSPRYSDTVLSATYQQLNTHKDFTLFSTYLFNQYRYQ